MQDKPTAGLPCLHQSHVSRHVYRKHTKGKHKSWFMAWLKKCPVCNTEISISSPVPLHGRSQTPSPSKGNAQQLRSVIPPRPPSPSWMTNLPRSLDAGTVSQHTSQVYHPHYHNHTHRNTSPMLNTGGSLINPLDTSYGVFGEMIYARIFGNQVTDVYTYPNSYNLSGISNPRIRRHLRRADKSLGRICFFLLCCTVLFLLLFWLQFRILCVQYNYTTLYKI